MKESREFDLSGSINSYLLVVATWAVHISETVNNMLKPG